jgi:predicted RNase H-like nuclease
MARAAALGVDLAWSDRNPSGVCALDAAGRVIDEQLLETDDQIVDWIAGLVDGPATVGIDAPLLVPNETGRRSCENELARVYGGRRAGPHSSNRSLFLGRYGRIRGEDLAVRLAALGFRGPWSGGDRTLLEVYPHPALIEAFGLGERLRYKSKPGLGPEGRRAGLRILAGLLAVLSAADPPLRGGEVDVPAGARGKGAKAIEDRLDARVAAWVAAVWARHGTNRIRLFGTAGGGHIAVPVGRFVDHDPSQRGSSKGSVDLG